MQRSTQSINSLYNYRFYSRDKQTSHEQSGKVRYKHSHYKNFRCKFAYSIGTLHKDTNLRCTLQEI